MNSRRKGKVGERQARDVVRVHLFAPDCIRAAQSNGKHSADLLNVGEGVHAEVKFVAKLGCAKFMLQATRDAKATEFPIVLMRENAGGWLLMLKPEDSLRFARMVIKNKEQFDAGSARQSDQYG